MQFVGRVRADNLPSFFRGHMSLIDFLFFASLATLLASAPSRHLGEICHEETHTGILNLRYSVRIVCGLSVSAMMSLILTVPAVVLFG